MGIITPLLDVVAGVAILAGRSSLLDTGVFKTANTNFTIRHILALGFIGVGVWNLWKIERAQDKLKKSLGAEDYTEIGICDYGLVCDQNIPTPLNEYGICQDCQEQWEYENEMFPLEAGAEIWAEAVDWFDEQGSDNEGFPYGISYMAGPERGEIEWFSDEEERDMVLDTYIGEMEGELYTTDPETGMVVPMNAESFGAEPMFVESDSLMVELMGFDGSYRTDGEVKVGYTTAAELGFEPKELKPVMWVWDDIEGYGAFMPTEKIRFIAEYFE